MQIGINIRYQDFCLTHFPIPIIFLLFFGCWWHTKREPVLEEIGIRKGDQLKAEILPVNLKGQLNLFIAIINFKPLIWGEPFNYLHS
jgi:hypothetical protein